VDYMRVVGNMMGVVGYRMVVVDYRMVVVEVVMMAAVWSGRALLSHHCGNGSLRFLVVPCMNMPIASHHN